MHMDPEFKHLGILIIGKDLNTTDNRDHIPEIEKKTQVVKEGMHAVHGGLPYDCMTSKMITELGNYAVMTINTFPTKSGISRTYNYVHHNGG